MLALGVDSDGMGWDGMGWDGMWQDGLMVAMIDGSYE